MCPEAQDAFKDATCFACLDLVPNHARVKVPSCVHRHSSLHVSCAKQWYRTGLRMFRLVPNAMFAYEEPNVVKILVTGGDTNTYFRIVRSDQFKRLMDAYCGWQGKDKTKNVRIWPSKTSRPSRSKRMKKMKMPTLLGISPRRRHRVTTRRPSRWDQCHSLRAGLLTQYGSRTY